MKISIIVPIYNAEQYLENCLLSIQNQSFQEFEAILINDGSTDESGTICEQFHKKDERFQVVHQRNAGLSMARNAGLEKARGEYVCFVDADDLIAHDYLKKQYENIVASRADLAICDYIKFTEDIECDFTERNVEYKLASKKKLLLNLCTTGPHNESEKLVIACNKLYRKTLFEQIHFPPHLWHEDEYVIHHILAKADRVIISNQILYGYRQHPKSFMQNANTANDGHMDLIKALDDRLVFIMKQKDRELLHAVLISFFENLTFLYLLAETEKLRSARKRKVMNRMVELLFHYGTILTRTEIKRYLVFLLSPEKYKKRYWN